MFSASHFSLLSWIFFLDRKSQASREDLEYFECQKEMMEQLLDSHCQAERIVGESS